MSARSPVVLITTDRQAASTEPPTPNRFGRIRPVRAKAHVLEAYIDAVRAAGGLPLLVPPGASDVQHLLDVAHAVVLTGGDMDIHPSHYGEAVTGRLDRVEPGRTALELELARACLVRGTPVFGVCGGMQALAVAAGGSLIQDLPPADATLLAHEQATDPATPAHAVQVRGRATAWFGERCDANSTHHQAVRRAGTFEACGWADDGVVEVILHPDHPFALGVQWHPELLGQLEPYRALVDAARRSPRPV